MREEDSIKGLIDDPVGEEILELFGRGDKSAFRLLFRAYRKLVFSLLYQTLAEHDEIEDVMQTVFLEVFRSLPNFQRRSKLSSWISRITLNVGFRHVRYRRSRPSIYQAKTIEEDKLSRINDLDPETDLLKKEAAQRFREVIASLSPRKRTVFVLNELQGLPQEEIAEIVGTSIATVRTRLFYARKEFWKKIRTDPVLKQMAEERLTRKQE